MSAHGGDANNVDLGVLVVHGIGAQGERETLEHFGGSLVKAMRAHPEVEVLGAVDRAGDEIRATIDVDGVEQRVLIREGRWDQEVEPPSLLAVIAWTLIVSPWVLHREALLWHARRNYLTKRQTVSYALSPIALTLLLLRFLFLLALSLLIQVLAIVGLLLAWVPPVGRLLRAVFSATVGDAWAFVQDDEAHSSISGKVNAELARLSMDCDRVVLVAHSQGAAVSHEAIRSTGPPANLSTLVTVGGGIGKLLAMRALSAHPGSLILWSVGRFAPIALAILSFERLGDGVASTLLGSIGTASAIAMFLLPALGVFRSNRATESLVAATPGLGETWRWIDFWSPRDLVPDGRLRAGHHIATGAVQTYVVKSKGSFFLSHVNYFDTLEAQFDILDAVLEPAKPLLPWPAPSSRLEKTVLPDLLEIRHRRSRRAWCAVSVALILYGVLGVVAASLDVIGDYRVESRTRDLIAELRTVPTLGATIALIVGPAGLTASWPIRRPGRRHQPGRTAASIVIAFLMLGLMGVGFGGLAILTNSTRGSSELAVGDCVDVPRDALSANTGGLIIEFTALPCVEDHQYRVARHVTNPGRGESCGQFERSASSTQSVSAVSTTTWLVCLRPDRTAASGSVDAAKSQGDDASSAISRDVEPIEPPPTPRPTALASTPLPTTSPALAPSPAVDLLLSSGGLGAAHFGMSYSTLKDTPGFDLRPTNTDLSISTRPCFFALDTSLGDQVYFMLGSFDATLDRHEDSQLMAVFTTHRGAVTPSGTRVGTSLAELRNLFPGRLDERTGVEPGDLDILFVPRNKADASSVRWFVTDDVVVAMAAGFYGWLDNFADCR